MVLSTLEEKVSFFKNISNNSLEELLGIIPPPYLVHAVAFDVKQSTFYLLWKLSAVNWKNFGLSPTWHTPKSDFDS